jgi:uncharacterized membrane protein YfcA
MMTWFVPILAGLICGVFSGLGIGGGTLLMVYMTAIIGMDQRVAQGINLLYFLPTAVCALIFYMKGKLIRWNVVIPAALAGCAIAALTAWLALSIDTPLLRKLFGGFLLLVGLSELFGAQRAKKAK